MRGVGAEVEFEVVEEARRGEVGGAGEDARLVAEDERLAVEELAPVHPDLGRRAVEERDQALDGVDRLRRERDEVAIGLERRPQLAEALPQRLLGGRGSGQDACGAGAVARARSRAGCGRAGAASSASAMTEKPPRLK